MAIREFDFSINPDSPTLKTLLDKKQNITDDSLTTTAKTIVGAIKEVFTDVNAVEDEVTNLQNGLIAVNSDIDALKFQNFDINFHTLMTNATNQTTKMMGKITIGLGTLFQSVWSITSRPTSGFEVKIQDLGLYFHCYKINGVIDNSVKYVTGTWTGDNFLINNFHGYEVEEPNENTYKIYFYDDILGQQAVLSLDISPLKNSDTFVNNNPKKYGEPINVKMLELENKITKLENFNTELMKLLGVK